MTQTKHTSGPWERDDLLLPNGRPVIARTAGNIPISATTDDWLGQPGEDEANACLIAAAPELLEALEDLIETIDAYDLSDEIDSGQEDDGATLKARAAIAKALGENAELAA
jgi:hypothetical protein